MLCQVCKTTLEGTWDLDLAVTKTLLEPFQQNNPHTIFCESDWEYEESFASLPPHTVVLGHHTTSISHAASAKEGCVFCDRWYNPNLVPKAPNLHIDGVSYYSVVVVNTLVSSETKASIFMLNELGPTEFHLVSEDDPTYDYNMCFHYEPNTNGPETWKLIELWMEQCVNLHRNCRLAEVSSSYRPSRLIEVSNGQSFRLVNGTECPSSLKYATLSHCWGSSASDRFTLLATTVEDLRRPGRLEDLPATFREAIQVIAHFDISYIWIDRLCIFQDSEDDWQKESSTMQDVYRYSWLNIAALGAGNDQDGCFFKRDPRQLEPGTFRLRRHDGVLRSYRAGQEERQMWFKHFENEPLVQRSWVTQERLLSPRGLYFGKTQVFWECREATLAEMHPDGVYDIPNNEMRIHTDNSDDPPAHWKRLLNRFDRAHAHSPREQLLADWYTVIETYAGLSLTMPRDKLVAVSGLANDLQTKLCQSWPESPHRYLAGLWEDGLMVNLGWRAHDVNPRRSSVYRAPTWSWACLDGDVLFPGCINGSRSLLCSILSAQTTPIGSRDTGEVRSGCIVLKGPLLSTELGAKQVAGAIHRAQNDLGVTSFRRVDDEGSCIQGCIRLTVDFDTIQDVRAKVHLLWLFNEVRIERGRALIFGWGLALERQAEGSPIAQYRRLGLALCEFETEEGLEQYYKDFERVVVEVI